MPDWTLQWIADSSLSISHSPLYSCERCPKERHEMLFFMAVERCLHNSGLPTHHIITEQDLNTLKNWVPKLVDDWKAVKRLFGYRFAAGFGSIVQLVFASEQGAIPSLGSFAEPLLNTCERSFTKLGNELQTLAEKVRNQNQRIDNLLNKVNEMRRDFS